MTNLFANAKVIKAPSKKPSKPEPEMVKTEGLSRYAAICAMETAIKALKETERALIEDQMTDHFVQTGPVNYKGEDGKATASLELRKRSAASGLTDSEVELLNSLSIPTEQVEDRAETFIINPEYAADNKLLRKVSDAISKVKDLPSDFLMFQESTKKNVTTEESLKALFKVEDKKVIAALLKTVGTLAIKPKTEASLSEVIEEISGLLVPQAN